MEWWKASTMFFGADAFNHPIQMWAVTNASNQCMGAWNTLALSNIGAWGSSGVAKIELTFYGGVPVKRCSDVDTNFEGRAFAGTYVHGLSTPAISLNQNRCLSLQWFSTGAFTRARDTRRVARYFLRTCDNRSRIGIYTVQDLWWRFDGLVSKDLKLSTVTCAKMNVLCVEYLSLLEVFWI